MGSSRAPAMMPRGRWVEARPGLWLGVVALAMALSGPSRGHAQDDEARARQLFLEGAEHYAAEEYAAAAESFAASHAIRPVPVVLFNLAQALRFAGHPGAALRAFEAYLVAEDDPGASRRQAVEAAIAELQGEVGSVQLALTPDQPVSLTVDGLEIEVDGRQPFAVGPGTHELRITAEGREPIVRSVEVTSGRTAVVRLRLGALPATLAVASATEGARVTLNGEPLGDAPIEDQVDSGEHTLVITAPGHERLERVITLAPGETLRLDLDLEVRHRLRDRWWVWAIVGGGAALALGLALAIGLPQRDPDPLEGTLPTIQAITWGGP